MVEYSALVIIIFIPLTVVCSGNNWPRDFKFKLRFLGDRDHHHTSYNDDNTRNDDVTRYDSSYSDININEKGVKSEKDATFDIRENCNAINNNRDISSNDDDTKNNNSSIRNNNIICNNNNSNNNNNNHNNIILNNTLPNTNNNINKNRHQSQQSYHKTRRQWQTLITILLNCGLDSIAVISDNPNLQAVMLRTISNRGIPFIHARDIGGRNVISASFRHFDEFIRRSYIRDTQKYFIIATDHPDHVLNRVESVFRKEPFRDLALLPHRTKWIVILWTGRQWEDLVRQQHRSILDNVVAISVREQTTPKFHYQMEKLSTFMWRENRTRQPDLLELDLNSLDQKRGRMESCHIFPNQYGGLNGRRLTVAPKVFLTLFLNTVNKNSSAATPSSQNEKAKNKGKKKKEYQGLLMELLEFSSNFSNYSYTMKEETSENVPYAHVSWDKYTVDLNNGVFDIGLSPYSMLVVIRNNLSYSYPVAFDKIVGIYRRPDNSMAYLSTWGNFSLFSPLGYLFLVVCAIYISCLYGIIIIINNEENNHDENNDDNAFEIYHTTTTKAKLELENNIATNLSESKKSETDDCNCTANNDEKSCCNIIKGCNTLLEFPFKLPCTPKQREIKIGDKSLAFSSKKSELVNEDITKQQQTPLFGSLLRLLRSAMPPITARISISSLPNFLVNRIAAVFLFLTAALNQGYLPRPRQFSAQLAIGVWAIGMVFFYAMFSSKNTAEAVLPDDGIPFRTVRDFLKQNKYSATVLKYSVLETSMRLAQKNTPIAKLKSKTKIIELHTGGDEPIDLDLDEYLDDLPDNVVFFHYESAIEAALRFEGNDKRYFIMDDDPIYHSDIAITFPHNSELGEMFSDDIMRLFESGIQYKLLKNHAAFVSGGSSSSSSRKVKIKHGGSSTTQDINNHPTVRIRHVFLLGVVCIICVVISTMAVAIEILIYRRHEIDSFIRRALSPERIPFVGTNPPGSRSRKRHRVFV